MPRGVELGVLVDLLRVEIGASTQASLGQNARPTLVGLLQRAQRSIYDENAWLHVKAQRDIQIVAGQRFYDFPGDMPLENVERIEALWGGSWGEIVRGIGGREYSSQNPEGVSSEASFQITFGSLASASASFVITGGAVGASNAISQIAAAGTNLLAAPVLWTSSHAQTALNVAAAINARTATTGYAASASGATVAIKSPADLGASADGGLLSVSVSGTVTVGSVTSFAGGDNNFVSAVLIDGLNVLQKPVGFRADIQQTAAVVADAINRFLTIPNYTARASANQVLVFSDPNAPATSNGLPLAVSTSGDVTVAGLVDMHNGRAASRCDPVLRWDVRDRDGTEQIEIWPAPASASCVLRLYGRRASRLLVSNEDTCDVDSDLVVLRAAADWLGTSEKTKNAAALKEKRFADRLRMLKHRQRGVKHLNIGPADDRRYARRGEIIVALDPTPRSGS